MKVRKIDLNNGMIPVNETERMRKSQTQEKAPLIEFTDPIQITQGRMRRIEDSIYPSLYKNYIEGLQDFNAIQNNTMMHLANRGNIMENKNEILEVQRFNQYATEIYQKCMDDMYISRIKNAIDVCFYGVYSEVRAELLRNMDTVSFSYSSIDNTLASGVFDAVWFPISHMLHSSEFRNIRFYGDGYNYDAFLGAIVTFTSCIVTRVINVIHDTILSKLILPSCYQQSSFRCGPESRLDPTYEKDNVYYEACQTLSSALTRRYNSLVSEVYEVLSFIKEQSHQEKEATPRNTPLIIDDERDS